MKREIASEIFECNVGSRKDQPGQSHGTLETSVAAGDIGPAAAFVRLSLLAFIPAGDALPFSTAFLAAVNRFAGGCGCGGDGNVVPRLNRVDDVNVLVEDRRVAELLVAVVTLRFRVFLLKVNSQGIGEREAL